MRKFLFCFIFLLPATSFANLIDKCGLYYAEGYYTEIESPLHNNQKKKVILLERGTNSEIKFYITNKDIQKLIPNTHLGVNFKLKLKFESSCFYACEGSVEELIAPLEPYQKPKPFLFPRPTPINKSEFPCKSKSFGDHIDFKTKKAGQ